MLENKDTTANHDANNDMAKAARNAEYLEMLDRAMEQLAQGRGQVHEIIEVEDD